MRLRRMQKACEKEYKTRNSLLTNGKSIGTMIEVAKLERSVKVVRFCIEPPSLPAMIGAAVAVGMIKHIKSPCASM